MSQWVKLPEYFQMQDGQRATAFAARTGPLGDSKLESTPKKNEQVVIPVDEKKAPAQNVRVSVKGGLVRKRKGKGGDKGNSDLPPPLDCMPVMRHTLRFYNSASVGTRSAPLGITSIGVLGALGTYCITTNTTVRCWAGAYRIRRITVYPAVSTTDNSDVEIMWAGDSSAAARMKPTVRDRSIPQGQLGAVRRISEVPPKDSMARMWQVSNVATTLFYIFIGQAGGILDLEVDWVLFNQTNTAESPTGLTVATGVVGTIYYLALDDPTSVLFQPVGRTPTTT